MTKTEKARAYTVACPHCNAKATYRCLTSSGGFAKAPHPKRLSAAKAASWRPVEVTLSGTKTDERLDVVATIHPTPREQENARLADDRSGAAVSLSLWLDQFDVLEDEILAVTNKINDQAESAHADPDSMAQLYNVRDKLREALTLLQDAR